MATYWGKGIQENRQRQQELCRHFGQFDDLSRRVAPKAFDALKAAEGDYRAGSDALSRAVAYARRGKDSAAAREMETVAHQFNKTAMGQNIAYKFYIQGK